MLMKHFRALSLIFIGLISLSLPASAFFHRGAVAIQNYFNGGGSQINRAYNTYYTGQDRWLNMWQQGDSPVMTVNRQVTITLSGGVPTINFLNNFCAKVREPCELLERRGNAHAAWPNLIFWDLNSASLLII